MTLDQTFGHGACLVISLPLLGPRSRFGCWAEWSVSSRSFGIDAVGMSCPSLLMKMMKNQSPNDGHGSLRRPSTKQTPAAENCTPSGQNPASCPPYVIPPGWCRLRPLLPGSKRLGKRTPPPRFWPQKLHRPKLKARQSLSASPPSKNRPGICLRRACPNLLSDLSQSHYQFCRR